MQQAGAGFRRYGANFPDRFPLPDDESGDEQDDQAEGWAAAGDPMRRGGNDARRVPLQQFLRLVAGGARVLDRVVAVNGTNDDLVSHLRKSGVIKHDQVANALRVCARDMFVPAEHQEEALIDAPIRLEPQNFNISAPHMHATCLEALLLKPGHRFLDVGSGCGVLTAAAALLVGRTGAAVGIDVKRCGAELGHANVLRLAEQSQEYADAAAPVAFHVHNVFVPSSKHKGQYDRVHVGAACPPSKLRALTALLGPRGGCIVTPVASDLRLITVTPDGAVSQKILSQVRYSDLEVPTDTEMLAAVVAEKRAERLALPHFQSLYEEDCAAILGQPLPLATSGSGRCSMDSDASGSTPLGRQSSYGSGKSMEGAATGDGSPTWVPASVKRLGKLLTACSAPTYMPDSNAAGSPGTASSMSSTCSMLLDDEQGAPPSSGVRPVWLNEDVLGPPDAALVTAEWSIPVHRAVMRQRCEHCRALCSSGMRDAAADTIAAPDATPQDAAAAFIHYLYADTLPPAAEPTDPQAVCNLAACLVHLGIYFGSPNLVALAEAQLAAMLKAEPTAEFDPVEAAPALLALADDNGLPGLTAAAADFCVNNHEKVAATAGYAALTKRQTDLVAAEACAAVSGYKAALEYISHSELLPEPDPEW